MSVLSNKSGSLPRGCCFKTPEKLRPQDNSGVLNECHMAPPLVHRLKVTDVSNNTSTRPYFAYECVASIRGMIRKSTILVLILLLLALLLLLYCVPAIDQADIIEHDAARLVP